MKRYIKFLYILIFLISLITFAQPHTGGPIGGTSGGSGGSANISNVAFGPAWDSITTYAPSKNAVYDALVLKAALTDLTLKTGADVAVDATGDTSPAITMGRVNVITSGASVTIASFNDGDDYSSFSNGQQAIILCQDADVTFDLTSNTEFNDGENAVDFTCSATKPTVFIAQFNSTETRFDFIGFPSGKSSPGVLAISRIQALTVTTGDFDSMDITSTAANIDKCFGGKFRGSTAGTLAHSHTIAAGENFVVEQTTADAMTMTINGSDTISYCVDGTCDACGAGVGITLGDEGAIFSVRYGGANSIIVTGHDVACTP